MQGPAERLLLLVDLSHLSTSIASGMRSNNSDQVTSWWRTQIHSQRDRAALGLERAVGVELGTLDSPPIHPGKLSPSSTFPAARRSHIYKHVKYLSRSPIMLCYTLPSSPSVLCEDRLSVLQDGEDLYVPFWSLLSKLLQESELQSPESLADLLDTIAVTRQGKCNSDYGLLKAFMSEHVHLETFFEQTWPKIRELALEMPSLFPFHSVTVLDESHAEVSYSRRQVACLVIHQFLGTLDAPTWQDGFQDFHIWYSAEQPHSKAVTAYLTALFTYFQRLNEGPGIPPLCNGWSINFKLHTCDLSLSHSRPTTLLPLAVLNIPEASTSASLLGLPDGAAVISANRFIGFGRTGTQEERHVGASPECCPAVLFTPPLRDEQVLVVTGAEAMITISGHGRDAHCSEVLSPKADSRTDLKWQDRVMLFMDALELDLESSEEGLPDLHPGNVERELRKACTAFQSRIEPPYSNIYTGYWGCRSFGGNPAVKTIIQWCAASLAGCLLTFICSNPEEHHFGSLLAAFVQKTAARRVPVDRLLDILQGLSPALVENSEGVLEALSERLEEVA